MAGVWWKAENVESRKRERCWLSSFAKIQYCTRGCHGHPKAAPVSDVMRRSEI